MNGPRTLKHRQPIYARGRLSVLGRFSEDPRICLKCRLISVLSSLLMIAKHVMIRTLLTESSYVTEF